MLWFDASSEDAVKDSFRIMAEAVFDARELATSVGEQSIKHTSRWLSDKRNTRWLLIFDNYDDPDSYRLPQYYPYAAHGSIIVTTRRPDAVVGKRMRLQPLRGMSEPLTILATRSDREDVMSGRSADDFENHSLTVIKTRMHDGWSSGSEGSR